MFALFTDLDPAGEAEFARVEARLGEGARRWRGGEGRGWAAATSGLLPEDVFDRQPIVAEDVVFICRVRLDDRAALAERLGIPGAAATQMADSALLFAAYRHWGPECPEHVAGDYVYAAWHWRERRLEAAVDHWGAAAPLFWARTPFGLAAADNLAALLEHRSISRALDLEALAGALQAGVGRTTTPYAAVRAVCGGHRLTWAGGGEPSLIRWWRPNVRPDWRRKPAECLDQARALFDQAVRARLRSTGGIASTLSGGLDSGLVTAVAARQLAGPGGNLTAFTSAPEPGLSRFERPGWDGDDWNYAAITASEQPALTHRAVRPDGQSPIDILPRLFAGAKLPPRGGANLLWLDRISRLARSEGARVLLVGFHGNSTLSWSGQGAVLELLRRGKWLEANRLLASTSKRSARPWLRELAGGLAPLGRAAARGLRPGAGADRAAAGFLRPERRLPLSRRDPLFSRTPGTRATWTSFATTPPHGWNCDAPAQWGLEWRDPMADRRLMEALLTFPLAVFQPDGWRRGLAREIGRGLLPDAVRLRTTQGQQVPERAALIRRAEPQYRSAVAAIAAAPTARELLDPAALTGALDRIAAGDDEGAQANGFLEAVAVGMFVAGAEGGT
jgi:asparagine synthase (glutamine-hydrolysing)